MRLSNTQAVARPTYYDRNTIVQALSFVAVTVAPHALTTRASYTVPVGKKAFIDFVFLQARRSAVATGAALFQAIASYTKSGGTLIYMFVAESPSNVVNGEDKQQITQAGPLLTGDLFSLQTNDASVAGTVDYNVNAKIDEFDA